MERGKTQGQSKILREECDWFCLCYGYQQWLVTE